MIDKLTDIPEIASYLRRIKAEARGLLTAVVMERRGKYWRDIAYIKVNRFTGDLLVSNPAYAPHDQEKDDIKRAVLAARWPEPVKTKDAQFLPEHLEKAHPDSLFEFRDHNGDLIMLQHRLDPKEDHEEKRYVPWTWWSDGKWRAAEPDGLLPLYGLDKIGNHTTIFIHEGAKAARAVQRMIDRGDYHPWMEHLRSGAHIGWSGGALNPERTDWAILTELGVKRAFIVSDNDKPGREAVAPISKELRFETYHVQFTDQWPPAFDLADPFPKSMFRNREDREFYSGPPFEACVHNATWMTDLIQVPTARGFKEVPQLRPHVTEEWYYIDDAEMYLNVNSPNAKAASEKAVNTILSAFSHSTTTCTLINKSYSGRQVRMCYRPDINARRVSSEGSSAINMHIPSHIKAEEGDPSMFLEFMEYLIPDEFERNHALRWIATLVAKPDIRIPWGVLLLSEKQGTGKSTLCTNILAPLVGERNVSEANENMIVESQFNSWLANKRLIIVHEIYSGHSWKAYNKLKNYVTETSIEVNEKNQKRYKIDCWAHFIACSNSMKAMKVENEDRRWFIPTVIEDPWPTHKFVALRQWIEAGGLNIIRYWAQNYGEYCTPSERAPSTDKKTQMIKESLSVEEQRCATLAERLSDEEAKIAFIDTDIDAWVRTELRGSKSFSTLNDWRNALRTGGFRRTAARVKYKGNVQYVMVSPLLYSQYKDLIEAKSNKGLMHILQPYIKHPADVAAV